MSEIILLARLQSQKNVCKHMPVCRTYLLHMLNFNIFITDGNQHAGDQITLTWSYNKDYWACCCWRYRITRQERAEKEIDLVKLYVWIENNQLRTSNTLRKEKWNNIKKTSLIHIEKNHPSKLNGIAAGIKLIPQDDFLGFQM